MTQKLLYLLLSLIPATALAEDRPNIILIMVDDMGRDWVSCYGAEHRTPHIDRLAQQGVRYQTAWCMPICTPTRVTLLTGQYPFHHGWTEHYDVPRWGGDGLRWTEFTTFARVLRDSGYATAIGGKWQINHLGKQPAALRKHGFDEHCVWMGVEAERPDTKNRYWEGRIMTNGRRETVPYGPDTINRFLIEFIQKERDQPFLVYYPMLLTHGPHTRTPLNQDDPPEGKPALYGGNVTYMDQLVGQLVAAVDEAGLADNTLILFTGDNGSASAGVLDGEPYVKGKGRVADHGAHVPFVVRAPFLTAGGRVSRDLVDFTDVYPTLVEVAGATLPEELELDGQSLLPSLRGRQNRSNQRSWIFSQRGELRMVRDQQHLLDSQGNFHDLKQDPRQENRIQSPSPEVNQRRERLQRILDRFPADAEAPFPEFEARHRKQ